MVGRTKPQQNLDHPEDTPESEIIYLRSKNSEMAKTLAETKISLKQSNDERDYFQRELMTKTIKNHELLNYIKHIEQAARNSIGALAALSNYVTEIVQLTMQIQRKPDSKNSSMHNLQNNTSNPRSPDPNKIKIVKPMIDGHVIHRPTISLIRVNELSSEEIHHLRSSTQTRKTQINSGNNASLNTETNSENVTFGRTSTPTASTSQSFNEIDNPTDNLDNERGDYTRTPTPPEADRHLHTIAEITEDLIDSAANTHEGDLQNDSSINLTSQSSRGPLLSGVFRDVRVYLSPMQNPDQYLNPLRGVTTNRGKIYNKTISPTLNNDNQIPCPDISNSPSPNATIEEPSNSILTSTRISHQFKESRKSNFSQSRWSSNFNNSTINENVTMVNHMKSPEWVGVKETFKGESRYSSFHTPREAPSYDPLEESSKLLDSNSKSTNKIETLSKLGLRPRNHADEDSSSSPSSPALTVLKRRKLNGTDTSVKKGLFVTHRKLLDSNTAAVSTKRITSRKSLDFKNKSTDKSERSVEIDNLEANLPNQSSSTDSSFMVVSDTTASTSRQTKKRKANKNISSNKKGSTKSGLKYSKPKRNRRRISNESDSSTQSTNKASPKLIRRKKPGTNKLSKEPQLNNKKQDKGKTSSDSDSSKISINRPSQKTPRKRRPGTIKTLKEPLLNKKLRRP